MNIKFKYIVIGLLVVLSVSLMGYGLQDKKGNSSDLSANKKPNIILIMADDMGYSDIGPYGSEIKTPNLDLLAKNGVRFRQFYNNARCCPTRASLLTGLYPHQAGIGLMTNDPEDSQAFNFGLPAYQGDLNFNSVTIGEVLRSAGYETLMTGKWHVGYHEKERWPLQRGFDKYYGILAGASNFFTPSGKRGLTLMNDTIAAEGDNYYTTDAFTDYGIKFINERSNTNDPFFLYLAYTSPHWPLHAMKEDIDRYRGKYKMGWKKLRAERFARMKKMGVIEKNAVLSNDDAADWDSLSEEQKEEMDLRMAIYAAQIDRMDQNIGKLINSLKKSGELDNTLIFFLSDNGACAEGGLLGMGSKDILETKKGYTLSYGQSWANASNTPFRKYKHWMHEGGISTPLIVSWPERMSNKIKGSFTNQYGFLQDIMATIVQVSGATYPYQFKGNTIVPLEGSSFVNVIDGNDTPIHTKPIFWEHEGNGAVRLGNLKLVKEYKPNRPEKWELYDIAQDRAEMNDISSAKPEVVTNLVAEYNQWAEKVGVVPFGELKKIKAKNKNK